MSTVPPNSAIAPSAQVTALPTGPGGSNATKKQLNDINVRLSMMAVQSVADQKYDPPVPTPVTAPLIKEAFAPLLLPSTPMATTAILLTMLGSACAVYGLCA